MSPSELVTGHLESLWLPISGRGTGICFALKCCAVLSMIVHSDHYVTKISSYYLSLDAIYHLHFMTSRSLLDLGLDKYVLMLFSIFLVLLSFHFPKEPCSYQKTSAHAIFLPDPLLSLPSSSLALMSSPPGTLPDTCLSEGPSYSPMAA